MDDTRSKDEYITLAEAADGSPYSQEYLSLRARQGKLRAVKRGRNWYTTPGWLDDYLQQVDVAKADLKAVEVVETPVVADTEPMTDPVAAMQQSSAPEPASIPTSVSSPEPVTEREVESAPFSFHPSALNDSDALDRSDTIGSIAREERAKPTGKNFSWEDDEPKQIAPTPEKALLMAHLQDKVDQSIAKDEPLSDKSTYNNEEPVIVGDGINLSAESAAPLGAGFVELGMNDGSAAADTVSNTEASLADEQSDDMFKDLHNTATSSNVNWLSKQGIAAAVILLIVVSNFSLLDNALNIRRNITAGFGIVLYQGGQNLIAAGKEQQENRIARAGNGPQIAIPGFRVDASELATSGTGTVAGASDEKTKAGFWETVSRGLRIVLGIE